MDLHCVVYVAVYRCGVIWVAVPCGQSFGFFMLGFFFFGCTVQHATWNFLDQGSNPRALQWKLGVFFCLLVFCFFFCCIEAWSLNYWMSPWELLIWCLTGVF